jgi:hypothetical protein
MFHTPTVLTPLRLGIDNLASLRTSRDTLYRHVLQGVFESETVVIVIGNFNEREVRAKYTRNRLQII